MDEKEERKIILDLPWFGNSAYIHRSLFSSIIGHLYMREWKPLYRVIDYMRKKEKEGNTRLIKLKL